MIVLLVWSLVDIEPPRLITSDNQVIDLLTSDPDAWRQHISRKNEKRVQDQVNRWKIAVQAGADAIEAYGYAISSDEYDFRDWLRHEGDSYPQCPLGH